MKALILLPILILIFSCRKDDFSKYNFGFTFISEKGEAQKVLEINNEIYVFGTSQTSGTDNFHFFKLDSLGHKLIEKTYLNENNQNGLNMIHSSDNNLILLGTSSSSSSRDILVKKVNLDGNEIWSIIIGGTEDEQSSDIIELENGNFCIAANTKSYGAGNNDIYLIWISQSGEIIKEKTYGGSESDGSTSILQSNSDIVVLGYTNSWGAGGQDYFLLKINAQGDSLWSKTYGGGGYEESQGIIKTNNNNYIINGHSSSIDPFHDMFAVSVSEDGNINWEKNYGGSLHDGGETIIAKSDGNYLLIGRSMSFGNNTRNIYMVTINSNGNIISEKSINTGSYDWIHSSIEYNGYYYMVGQTILPNQTNGRTLLTKIKC